MSKTGYRPPSPPLQQGATRQQPGSKIGYVGLPAPNRERPNPPQPQAQQGKADTRSRAFTYLTRAGGTDVLYNAERQWANVTLTLENAGPVAVGFDAKLTPVLSGKGQLLITNQERTFKVARGSRLYIAATGANRVKVTVESIPWLEQITGLLTDLVARLVKR